MVCSLGSLYFIYISYWFFFFIWDYFYVRCREVRGWEGGKMDAYFLLIISTLLHQVTSILWKDLYWIVLYILLDLPHVLKKKRKKVRFKKLLFSLFWQSYTLALHICIKLSSFRQLVLLKRPHLLLPQVSSLLPWIEASIFLFFVFSFVFVF